MLNDKTTSELMSKSLAGMLDADQQAQLDAQVEDSHQTQAYHKLNHLIHQSSSEVAKRSADGDPDIAPGLSHEARSRIQNKLKEESRRLKGSQLTETRGLDGEPLRQDQGSPVTDETDTETGATSTTAVPAQPSDSNASPVESRSVQTRYSLQKLLGAGGLGKVWLAHDETVKRNVALKEMNSAAVDMPRAWDRFHREAEITGRLEHPNVVPLYQHGMDLETGKPFYAMRFVGKRTLVNAIDECHEKMETGQDVTMDLHRLLTAFIGICQGIAYAHSRGVIHRDLKPENVALDTFGQVIVLDWGLAKVMDDVDAGIGFVADSAAGDSSYHKTMNGEVIGTPLYMAPEQAAGRLDDIDQRTDVYGLGAILFAILTGCAPHQNSSIVDGSQISVPALLKRISSEPVTSPSELNSCVPTDLAAICVKALQFRPYNRYQSATEVSDAVQQWMAGRNERRQQYSTARGECRELMTAMVSSLNDLERNVRFMSRLPPIQGIIDAVHQRGADEISTWKNRLQSIYTGLLTTNTDFSSVSFSQVKGGEFQQLIRVERQESDSANVRRIPSSRLVSGPLTSCMERAFKGNPDEVLVALASDGPVPGEKNETSRLAGTVPVFDEQTEDEFGLVMIETDLGLLIESMIQDRFRNRGSLFVLDDDYRILFQLDRSGRRIKEKEGEHMSAISPSWNTVLSELKDNGEFIDQANHEAYATSIDVVPGRHSLTLALCLAESE